MLCLRRKFHIPSVSDAVVNAFKPKA